MADELGQIVIKIVGDDDPMRETLGRLQGLVRGWASNVASGIDDAMRQASSQMFERISTQTDRIGSVLNSSLTIRPEALGIDQLGSTLASSEGQITSWASRVTGAVGRVFEIAGGVILSQVIGRGADAIKTALFDTNASLETSTLQFTTLMGDADAASEHVRSLFKFAAETPFETGPIIEASRFMETFGGAALNSKANLTLFGDAAAATGNQINEVGFWTSRAYDAIQSGRPFGESAARLQEMGILSGQARTRLEEMQKSGASGTEVWAAMTEELGKFNGAMIAQAGTWAGLTSSLSDLVNLNLATIFEPLFGGAKQLAGALVSALSSEQFASFVTNAQGYVEDLVNWLVSGAQSIMSVWAQVGPSVMAGLEALSTIGSVIGESLSAAFSAIADLASEAFGWGDGVASAFADGIAAGAGYVADALGGIADTVAYWLTPGSPPPLLPDLDVWGAGAASAYLEGWQDADFNALKSFGDDVSTVLENMVSGGKLGEGQDSGMVAALRTQFVQVLNEAKATGSVSAESMQKITDAAGPAANEVASLVRQHLDLAKATQRVNDAQSILQGIQSEMSAAQAEMAAAQATGNRDLATQARGRLTLLKQQKADAAAKQASAKTEQTALQQQLSLFQQLMDAQKEQLALIKKASDSGKKGGGGGGKKATDEVDKAKEAQWKYNYSLADTATKIQMLKEKQDGLSETSAEYWNLQGQITQLDKQQTAEAEKKAKALADAQFQHALATASTAQKVELLKGKLAGLDSTSAEYYQTLSQISQAEEQLAKERERDAKKSGGKGGGASGSPPKPGARPGAKPTSGGDPRADNKDWRAYAQEQARQANALVLDMKARIQDGLNTLIDPSTPGRIVTALGGVITGLGTYVGQQAPTIIGMFAGWSMGLLNWVSAAWPGLMTALGTVGAQIVGLIAQYAPGIIGAFSAWSIALLSWIGANGPAMIAQFGGMVGTILTAIGAALPGIVSAFAAWGVALTSWVAANGPALTTQLEGLLLNLVAWIVAAAPGIATQLLQWGIQFASWVIPAGAQLIMYLGTLFGDLLAWIVSMNPTLQANLQAWITAFTVWPAQAWLQLVVALTTFGTSVLAWITTMGTTLAANLVLGESFVTGMTSGITGTIANVYTEVQTGLDDALKQLEGYVKNFTDLGGNLIGGMISGIAAKAADAAKAVADVVKKALGGGQSEGEVQSPSKLFRRELGAYIGQGTALGITDEIPTAQAAMQSLVNGVAGVTSAAPTLGAALAGAPGADAGGLLGGLTGASIGQMIFNLEFPNVTDLSDPTVVDTIVYQVADRIKRASR